ncbi:hypothetical protein [Arenibaculum pallidiluteum]|uniref:hypothetical protein n=1 Tax=Arenibaculum pallidiluteum TaxID=2812559 RepID=UPI001A970BD0|nr:hypothetical protein [Arenibaculum pallidiluteum]
MQIGMPPPPPPPVKPAVAPQTVQATLQPAVIAAAATTQPQATLTAQAPQAAGRVDASRRNQSGTETGHSRDTLAGSLNARTNAMAAGGPAHPRGSLVDVRV